MNPNFGVGLRNFLFENKASSIPAIRQKINGQVTRYMPFIKINKLLFNHNIDPRVADDSPLLSILIEYDIPSLNYSTSLAIQSEDLK